MQESTISLIINVTGNISHFVLGYVFGLVTGNNYEYISGNKTRCRTMLESQSIVSVRVSKSRQRHKIAGLRRVEVLVPANHADAVRAYAAQLREGSQSESLVQLRKLIASAYQRFYATCLDNISVNPEKANFADGAIVAAALMHRGNSEAYKLGRAISRLAK